MYVALSGNVSIWPRTSVNMRSDRRFTPPLLEDKFQLLICAHSQGQQQTCYSFIWHRTVRYRRWCVVTKGGAYSAYFGVRRSKHFPFITIKASFCIFGLDRGVWIVFFWCKMYFLLADNSLVTLFNFLGGGVNSSWFVNKLSARYLSGYNNILLYFPRLFDICGHNICGQFIHSG